MGIGTASSPSHDDGILNVGKTAAGPMKCFLKGTWGRGQVSLLPGALPHPCFRPALLGGRAMRTFESWKQFLIVVH